MIDVSVYDYDEEGRMRVEREEGREEGRIETAKNLKCNGVPLELIAKCTGLSIETIEAL